MTLSTEVLLELLNSTLVDPLNVKGIYFLLTSGGVFVSVFMTRSEQMVLAEHQPDVNE